MTWRLVFALIALSAVRCEDLITGEDGGNLIYTEVVSASPLIPWEKTEHVYVETDDEDEFISKIVVVDMYPDKPGKVEIVEGGIGQEEVLLEFSRSGVFRGFQFNVEVYSKHDKSVPPHKPHKHDHSEKNNTKTVDTPTIAQSTEIPAVPKTLDVGAPVTNAAVPEVSPSSSEATPSVSPQDNSNIPQVATNVALSSDVSQTSDASQSSVTPLDSTTLDVRSDVNSTATPFVNSVTDGQTALVGLVIPIDANNNTRVRRQVQNNDIVSTTEVYDESSTDDLNVTGDY